MFNIRKPKEPERNNYEIEKEKEQRRENLINFEESREL